MCSMPQILIFVNAIFSRHFSLIKFSFYILFYRAHSADLNHTNVRWYVPSLSHPKIPTHSLSHSLTLCLSFVYIRKKRLPCCVVAIRCQKYSHSFNFGTYRINFARKKKPVTIHKMKTFKTKINLSFSLRLFHISNPFHIGHFHP